NGKTVMIVLSSSEQEQTRSIFAERKVLNIVEKELIPAFYRSKIKIDDENIENVSVLCSEKSAEEINQICQLMFTPVHKWNLVAPSNPLTKGDCKGSRNDVVEKVTQYLSSLDGDGDVELLTSPLIPSDVFYHGFSGRKGGISTVSGMKSLNMVYTTSKRDPPCVIAENHKRLSQKVPFDVSCFEIARAVHGNVIFEVGGIRPEAGYDGVVTNQKRMTMAAPGADCIVMLFADPINRVCGAIHSGWKGTVARICTEMLKTMQKNYGCNIKDIKVVMGPSISKERFEFGAEESKVFQDISPECVLWPEGKNRKPTIDLKLANRILLQSEGILPENIDDTSVSLCTVGNPHKFFSYRRDGRPFGNQIGFIGIK
ncbi:hypothetical protein FSP39_023645, partial [Pinctada imbricata]